jgi:membrane protein YqaA with SNARE-associated domain
MRSCFCRGVERVASEVSYETTMGVLRLIVSVAVLLAVVTFVGWEFRAELSSFGTWFVARFGVGGMIFGSFLADGIHFPVPPQFYLLTGIAGGYAAPLVIGSVLAGSELGGLAAFALGRQLAQRSSFLRARLARPRQLLARMMSRRGYLGLAIATLLPVSYSVLCMAGGATELPYRAYVVLGVMRVPRILISYAVIVLAWNEGAG